MKQVLPKKISVFPLSGAIFFPNTNLPLNIFEKRYLKMIEESLEGNNLIGMIQSKKFSGEVFKVGCLGKIDKHERTSDGRILINLKGLTRFKIDKEVNNDKAFREFMVNYDEFKEDLNINVNDIQNSLISELIKNSKKYFYLQKILIDWNEISKLKNFQIIYTLAMISPFSVVEKQKLLETPNLNEVAKTLNEILKFGLYDSPDETKIVQ